MESNNPLAEDGKRVLLRQNETPPYCKSSLCCVISVSDSSVHFVAEFLHCSVKSGLCLQPWDTPSRDPRLKTVPTSRGALYDCVSWFKLFSFPLPHKMKSRRSYRGGFSNQNVSICIWNDFLEYRNTLGTTFFVEISSYLIRCVREEIFNCRVFKIGKNK